MPRLKSNVKSKRKAKLSTNRKDFIFTVGDTVQFQDVNTGEFQYGCVEGTIEGNPIVRRITKEEAGPNPKRFTPRLPCSIDRSETGSVVCSSHGEDLIGIITRVEDESPLPGHVTSWLCPVSNEELFEDA
jgi:NADH dehydrogenase FAD-containing subunit